MSSTNVFVTLVHSSCASLTSPRALLAYFFLVAAQVNATERDVSVVPDITYAIAVGNTSVFGIVGETGVIFLKANLLDYEDVLHRQYNLLVTATDADGFNSTAAVRIVVTDINDNAPVFTSTTYTLSVSEGVAPGMIVEIVQASDRDAGANQVLEYYLDQIFVPVGAASIPFQVDLQGIISVTATVDREEVDQYQFTVGVRDGGAIPLVGEAAIVTVIVLDTNDNDPTFDVATATVHMPRNLAVGSSVYTANATDVDAGSNAVVKYSILYQNPALFAINDTSGIVAVVQSACQFPTRESFSLTLRAQDGGVPPRTTVMLLEVIVDNFDATPPLFAQATYDVTTAVGAPPNVFVAQLAAGSPCFARFITYSIAAGNAQGFFQVDGGSGVVTTTAVPVTLPAVVAQYVLTVRATDPNGQVAFASLAVTVVPAYTGAYVGTGSALQYANVGAAGGVNTASAFATQVQMGPAVGVEGSVVAVWGQTTQTVAVQVVRRPAAQIAGLVLDTDVWANLRVVRVVVQLTDARGCALVQASTVVVTVVPEDILTAVSGTPLTGTCTVSATTTTGICDVTIANMPNAFFTSPLLSNDRVYTLTVTATTASVSSAATLGVVALHRPRTLPAIAGDVVMELPPHAYYTGQALSCPVHARATYEITAFTVFVDTSALLTIDTDALPLEFDTSKWSIQSTTSSVSNRTVVSGTMLASYEPATAAVSAPETLFTLWVQTVPSSTTTPTTASVEVFVETLSEHVAGPVDVRGVPKLPGDAVPRGSVWDINGLHLGAAGYLPVNVSVSRGILAYVPQTRLVNTHGLLPSTIDIRAVRCMSCPRLSGQGACRATCDAIATPVCTQASGSHNAFQLDGCRAFVDGSETQPTVNAVVTVMDGGGHAGTATVALTVLRLSSVTVTTSLSSLHAIAGYAQRTMGVVR